MDYAKIALKMREQMLRFSGGLSRKKSLDFKIESC